jgi:hypothetical protein
MKLKFILILLLVVTIVIALIELSIIPIKKTIHFNNCKESYDYWKVHGNNNYSSNFSYVNAKARLLKCMCDEYEKTKDLVIKKSIIDSLKSEEEFVASYLYKVNDNTIFSYIVKVVLIEKQFQLVKISPDSLLMLSDKYQNSPNLNIEKDILTLFNGKFRLGILLDYLRKDKGFEPNIDIICKYKEIVFDGLHNE